MRQYYFEYEDIQVILKNSKYYKEFINKCIKEGKIEMLCSISGIIDINSIYC